MLTRDCTREQGSRRTCLGSDVQGCRADDGSGALVAPIHVATTFERGPGIDYPRGYVYSRISNPGRSLFEVTMAKVEGGVSGAAFGSGKIAAHAEWVSVQRSQEL